MFYVGDTDKNGLILIFLATTVGITIRHVLKKLCMIINKTKKDTNK